MRAQPEGVRASGVRPLLRKLRDAAIELLEGLTELLLPCGMGRNLGLALHLGARQAERLELARALRVYSLRRLAVLLPFLLALFHTLGEAGLRVDEAFSGITHMRRLSVGLCSSADGSRAGPADRMLDYTVKKAALFPGSVIGSRPRAADIVRADRLSHG
jgi:hypothetical protein